MAEGGECLRFRGDRDPEKAGTVPVPAAAVGSPQRLGGVLPIAPATPQGRSFALHPLLGTLQTMFEFFTKWIAGTVAARKTAGLLGQQGPWLPGSRAVGAAPTLRDEELDEIRNRIARIGEEIFVQGGRIGE